MALASFAFSQPNSTSNLDRESFADRNAQELRQLRSQVDAAARSAPQDAQVRFATVYDALATAEDALAQFKTASELEVGKRRTDFEQARTRAVRLWSDFRIATTDTSAPATR